MSDWLYHLLNDPVTDNLWSLALLIAIPTSFAISFIVASRGSQ